MDRPRRQAAIAATAAATRSLDELLSSPSEESDIDEKVLPSKRPRVSASSLLEKERSNNNNNNNGRSEKPLRTSTRSTSKVRYRDVSSSEEDAISLKDDEDEVVAKTRSTRSSRNQTSSSKKQRRSRGNNGEEEGLDDNSDENDDDNEEEEEQEDGDFDNSDDDNFSNKKKKASSSKQPRRSSNFNRQEGMDLPNVDVILSYADHTIAEWEKICESMNTAIIVNGSRWKHDKPASTATDKSERQTRYLVKWTGLSYLHVSWELEQDLYDNTGSDITTKMRLLQRKEDSFALQKMRDTFGERAFQPEFQQVDRIVDETKGPNGNKHVLCLVKWSGLGYDELTWEDLNDIGSAGKIALLEFRRRSSIPTSLSSSTARKAMMKQVIGAKRPGISSIISDDLDFKDGNMLRNYQLVALKWMLVNWMNKRGSILADEMGLGKTCTSVSFANQLKQTYKQPGPILVLAPLATLPHWIREFKSWTDLNTIVYHGSADARKLIQDYEFYYKDPRNQGKLCKECFKFDALITNFETALADFRILSSHPWSLLIVDEAHRLKNSKSQLYQVITENFKYDSQLLLTGTPIQNSIQELYTLLDLADPGAFGKWSEFEAKYGDMKTSADLEAFHEVLRPYLLRRFKSDVELNLPVKEETIIEVEMTQIQKTYYRAIYEKNINMLTQTTAVGSKVNLNNIAMQLRKCCIHPYLLEGVEEKLLNDLGLSRTMEACMNQLISASGKTILLDKLLIYLKSQGRRVLIFSQMTRVLDILEDYMNFKKFSFERIDGSLSMRLRQEAIDRYSTPGSSTFCFLLSTRGCGQGINLTAADAVIMFDNDWNPQNDVQAQARCHRIGQTKNVSVYRFVTRKSYEMEMFVRAGKKLGLDQAILLSMTKPAEESSTSNSNTSNSGMIGDESITLDDEDNSNNNIDGIEKAATKKKKGGKAQEEAEKKELERLLKLGAYALTEDEAKARADEQAFSDANVEDLLKRSIVVNYEDKKISGVENKFSTATFVSSASGIVEVDDPKFWEKVVGVDASTSNGPEELGKRARKRVVYNENEHELVYGNEVIGRRKKTPKTDTSYLILVKNFEGYSDKQVISLFKAISKYGVQRWTEVSRCVKDTNQTLCTLVGRGIVLTLAFFSALERRMISPIMPNLLSQIEDFSMDMLSRTAEEQIDHEQPYHSKEIVLTAMPFLKSIRDSWTEMDVDEAFIILACFIEGPLSDFFRNLSSRWTNHLTDLEFLFSQKQNFVSLLQGRVTPTYEKIPWWTFEDDVALLNGFCTFGWPYDNSKLSYEQMVVGSIFPGFNKKVQEMSSLSLKKTETNESTSSSSEEQNVQDETTSTSTIQNDLNHQNTIQPPQMPEWNPLVRARFKYLIEILRQEVPNDNRKILLKQFPIPKLPQVSSSSSSSVAPVGSSTNAVVTPATGSAPATQIASSNKVHTETPTPGVLTELTNKTTQNISSLGSGTTVATKSSIPGKSHPFFQFFNKSKALSSNNDNNATPDTSSDPTNSLAPPTHQESSSLAAGEVEKEIIPVDD